MTHDFDQAYWDDHWQQRPDTSTLPPPNPHLLREVGELPPGTALEAGCGEGAEAIWLAQAGWRVMAADIASEPLGRAADRARAMGVSDDRIQWVRADLCSWEPSQTFDLVTTHYAHPSMPQLEFYDRLATWVAPGGSLLVVGHLHTHHSADDDLPPVEASVTAARITERFDPATWEVVTASEHERTVGASGGRQVTLHDVAVRAVRRIVSRR